MNDNDGIQRLYMLKGSSINGHLSLSLIGGMRGMIIIRNILGVQVFEEDI